MARLFSPAVHLFSPAVLTFNLSVPAFRATFLTFYAEFPPKSPAVLAFSEKRGEKSETVLT
jgi:hypothetical protein